MPAVITSGCSILTHLLLRGRHLHLHGGGISGDVERIRGKGALQLRGQHSQPPQSIPRGCAALSTLLLQPLDPQEMRAQASRMRIHHRSNCQQHLGGVNGGRVRAGLLGLQAQLLVKVLFLPVR